MKGASRLARKVKVENKYNIKPSDIEKIVVLDKERLRHKPFWNNNVVNAYCLSGSSGTSKDEEFMTNDEYWIGFYYDAFTKDFNGKISFKCYSWGGICVYNFKSFYDFKEIEFEVDLQIQEMILRVLNQMFDDKVFGIRGKVNDDVIKELETEFED